MKPLLIVCICLTLKTVIAAPTPPKGFDHHMTVVADEYNLYWNVEDEEITFQVQVKTLGYVGFGISPKGGMAGADIVTMWVKDKLVYFQDKHATRNAQPETDEEQNWQLIEGMEVDGYTVVTFKRPLISCDKTNDMDINDYTMRLIYAYHPDDPTDAASLPYHGTQTRGTKSTALVVYGTRKTVNEIPPDTIPYDFKISPIEIPAEPTTYWCHSFKMPELKEKHHVVRFEPIIQQGNEGITHHIVMYSCLHDFDEEAHEGRAAKCYSDLMGELNKCSSITFVWAVGATALNFPEHTGFPIGAGLKPSMVRLEIHYDNPSSKSGIVDSAGIRMYYTRNLRKFDAGYLTVGAVLATLVIPPNFESLTTQAHCTKECLSKAIPDGKDLKIFAVALHSHLLGTELRVRHFRDGKELPPIAMDEYYDFNYQDIRILPQEISIKQGDYLLTECVYKSRENITYGGFGTTDEMCYAFMSYYPKTALSRCLSATTPLHLMEVINATLEFNENDNQYSRLFNFNITGPEKYAHKDPGEVINLIDWTDISMRQKFQNVLKKEETFAYMICDEGPTNPLLQNPFVKTPNIMETYEAPIPTCTASVRASSFLIVFVSQIIFLLF